MIDYDDLTDDLLESAAQSYDVLSTATIDVLNRAVAAIAELRGKNADQLAQLKVWHPGYIDQSKSGIFVTQQFPRMVLCENCGNKRCPRAGAPQFKCTGSNEPGQVGVRITEWSSSGPSE